MIIGARQDGLSILETAAIFPHNSLEFLRMVQRKKKIQWAVLWAKMAC